MQKTIELIEYLRKNNATHLKSGFRMQDKDLTDLKVLGHLSAEAIELAEAIGRNNSLDILEELADIGAVWLHLLSRFGISEFRIEMEMDHKLRERFTVNEISGQPEERVASPHREVTAHD